MFEATLLLTKSRVYEVLVDSHLFNGGDTEKNLMQSSYL